MVLADGYPSDYSPGQSVSLFCLAIDPELAADRDTRRGH